MANILSIVVVEVVKNDRPYRFEVPFGVSYQDAQAAGLEVVEALKEMERQAIEAEEKRKQEQPEVVEVAPES